MGEGGSASLPYRRPADDGKRLGLSESALDVAFSIVYEKGEGVRGRGGKRLGSIRRLADDGKR